MIRIIGIIILIDFKNSYNIYGKNNNSENKNINNSYFENGTYKPNDTVDFAILKSITGKRFQLQKC
jgi:hypothetical protein